MPDRNELPEPREILPLEEIALDDLYELLWKRLKRARIEAQRLTDEYWHAHHLGRQNAKNRTEAPKYGCKIRDGKFTFNPHWFAYRWSRDGRRAFTVYLKPCRGYPAKYSPVIFHNAPPWEQQVISAIEPQFAEIRTYVYFLYSMIRTVRGNEAKIMRLAGVEAAAVARIQERREEGMNLARVFARSVPVELARPNAC